MRLPRKEGMTIYGDTQLFSAEYVCSDPEKAEKEGMQLCLDKHIISEFGGKIPDNLVWEWRPLSNKHFPHNREPVFALVWFVNTYE